MIILIIIDSWRFKIRRTSLYDLEARSYDEDNDVNNVISASDNDYTDVLPSLHMIYDLDGVSKLGVALTKSLARPNYFDTVPYQQVKIEDEEIKVGNPKLEPTISTNFDISFERYYDDVGLLSAGILQRISTILLFILVVMYLQLIIYQIMTVSN